MGCFGDRAWRPGACCAAIPGAGMAMTRCPTPRAIARRAERTRHWRRDQSEEGRDGTMDQKNIITFMVLSALIFVLFWLVLPHYFPTYFSGPNGGVTQSNTGNTTPAATESATTQPTTAGGQPAVPAAPALS